MFSVFKTLNYFVGRSRLLDGLAVFCARYLAYLMAIFLLGFCIWQKNIIIFVYALISALLARFVINEAIYMFYKEKRPAHLPGTKVLIPVPRYPSFPSGHASLFFATSFYILFYNIPLAIIFILLSFLMGIARVFCGVHWFKDILAGFVVGFISAMATYYLLFFVCARGGS